MRRRGACGPLFLAMLFVLVACSVFASLAAVLIFRGEVPVYAPRLTRFEPHPGYAFRPTTPITLTFDQPMDPASVQAVFSLEPAVEGTFEWSGDHRRVTFVPDGAGYETGTTYTARLEAGAGAAMFSRTTARAVEWRFSLPPLLQFSSPAPGASGVPAGPLLQAAFNYALDCDLVLRTFTIEPDTPGRLDCEGQTVVFSPTQPLRPDTAYAAGLAHVFLDADPNPRPGVQWMFHTAPPLTIEEVDPAPQALVQDFWSAVRIGFNRPVVAGSVLPRFSLVDEEGEPVRGQVDWESSGGTFVFQPEEPLRPETGYHLELQAGVQDELGFSLARPLALDFETLGLLGLPEPIPGTEDVTLDSVLRIPFTRPMDRASVEAGLTFTPTLEGEVRWEGDTLIFAPRGGLAGGTSYTVGLSPDVRDTTGVRLSRHRAWPFSTEPFLLQSSVPSGRAVRRLQQPLELSFALPMDAGSVAASLSISPTTPGELVWGDDGQRVTFEPQPGWHAGAEYQVSLAATARTDDGLQSLGEDLVWMFATAAVEVSFGEGPNVQVVDAAGPRAFQAVLRGADVADFHLYPITPTQFLELYSSGFRGIGPQEPVMIPTAGLTPTVEWRAAMTPLDGGTIGAGWSPVEGHLPADLAPGLYVLSGNSVAAQDPPAAAVQDPPAANGQLMIVLTEHALVLKRALAGTGSQSRAQVLAWDTELGSGAPVVSATVRLHDREGNALAQGVTDADGLLALDLPGDPEPLLALAEAEGDVTVCGFGNEWSEEGWWWWWAPPARRPLYTTYAYTDRPIYRPGQQIHFKNWIRADDDVSYTLPAPDLPVTVRLRDARDNVAATRVLTPTAFGTISGTFQLADEPMLGTWHLETEVAGTVTRRPLQVEAYRKPEFEVTVSTQQKAYVPGETISVTVEAAYYSGQPASAAAVVLQAYPTYGEDYYGEAGRRFGYALRSEEGRTDTRGRWTAELPAEALLGPAGGAPRLVVALEATVADDSGQAVSSYQLVTIHRAALGLNLSLERHGYGPDEEISFAARLLDLDGDSVSGAELVARVFGWDDAEVAAGTATTDETGRGHFSVRLAEQGWYHLTVSGADGAGHEIVAEDWLWVYDPEGQAPWYKGRWGQEAALSVSADRASYAVGDEARLVVNTPTPGPALLTLERGETRYARPIVLVSGTNLITVPVRADYAPNVYVTVNQYGPPDREAWGFEQSRPDAELHTARAQILVPMAGRRLTVTLEADREGYAPGDEAVLHLRVVDAAGQPVAAEVSVAIVDEAIFALAEDVSEDPFEAFYAPRPDTVRTLDSLRPTRWLFGQGGMGGGDGDGAGTPRRDFADTAYWAPALVTDENGEAMVRLDLPDNLTEWRVLARAVTTDTLVGQASTRLVTSQDLVLRPALPRFLVAGDTLTVTAQVQNFLSEPVSATVSLDLAGPILAAEGGAAAQVVHVPAGGSVLVGWPALVQEPAAPLEQGMGQARVTLSALATRRGTRLVGRDAVESTLPVRMSSVPEVTTFAGDLTPARSSETMTITVPADALQGLSRLQIELAPSLAPGLLDGAEYLVDYPYGCVEQTMSRVLPNAVVGRAFRELGRRSELLEADLPAMVELGLQKLYGYQHQDGGWGWWYDDDTNLDQTAYVLFGLALTEQAGFGVDDGVMDRGSASLQRLLPGALPASRAYGAYVLATAGRPLTVTLGLTEALSLDPFSLAALALALDAAGDGEAAVLLLDELRESAIHDGATTHWRGDEGDYGRSMGSDVRTTALVVEALVRLDPEFAAPVPAAGGEGATQERALLPRAVRWLMQQRQGAGWGDTQRTSYALLALSDYLLASRLSAAGGGYQVYVGQDLWVEGELAGEGAGETLVLTYSHALSPALLLPGENEVRIVLGEEGTAPAGQLYYRATWQVQRLLRADEFPALAPAERSIGLEREYRLLDGGEAPARFRRGDLVEVRLTLQVPAESWYVTVEDPLPAGLEALNERLGTTSHAAAAYEEPAFFWQELGYNRKDVRDDRVTFFFTRLEPGRHVVRYLARAVTAGDFMALPAEAYLMYEPEVWSRSAGGRL